MDISEIRKLIRLIQDTDVTEIEVSDGAHTVRLSRQTSIAPAPAAAPQMQHVVTPAAPAAQAPAAPTHDEAHLLKSPMVGTFYRSASPEAEAFVAEGKKIKKGETLCIIEAMKLMNEIESDVAGVIVKRHVNNAQPVEYSQALFAIRPR